MKSTIVIAALVATALGAGAVVPAIAQQDNAAPPAPPSQATPVPPAPDATTPDRTQRPMHRMLRNGGGKGGMMGGGMMGGRLLALACSDRGPAIFERMLDRTSTRLGLSADQQKLFDAFRSKALISETGFSESCKAARPDRSAGRPDMIARLKAGLAVDQARIAAINDVLPEFQALFESLTPAQKAQLRPGWMGMGQNGWNQGGMNRGGMGPDGGMPHHWGNGGPAAPSST